MDKGWYSQFQVAADALLKEGAVREIDFSKSTYQVEVFDPAQKESFYPFLQLDQAHAIEDSFCDCKRGSEGCLHLACAYKALFDGDNIPWHLRFENSFYRQAALLYAEQIGYENATFTKEKKGHYSIAKGAYKIVLTVKATKKIEMLLFAQEKATPESSIKFSNVSQEQVQHWREGRTDPELRFELSLFADLMKELFWLQQKEPKAKLVFKETKDALPLECTISFSALTATFTYDEKGLEKLIPSLEEQNSSLVLDREGKRQLLSITFDAATKRLLLAHEEKESSPAAGLPIGKWLYLPKVGFKALLTDSMIEQPEIAEKEIAHFLTTYTQLAKHYLKEEMHLGAAPFHYHLFFDKEWNLHIDTYLLTKGDLTQKGVVDFGSWMYLPKKGFVQVGEREELPFAQIIPQKEVASFVTEKRVWLSDQNGFATHLAAIESALTYEVDKEGKLSFKSELMAEMEEGSFDFGEWVYYEGRGFFAKRRSKMGIHVRPDVKVIPASIPRFIRENSEELEGVLGFFAPTMPLQKSELLLAIKSPTSLYVKPKYTFYPEFAKKAYRFYGEYLYVEESGFSKLPLELRLPEGFSEAKVIHKGELAHFIGEVLPKLSTYIKKLPKELTQPNRCDVELHYLVRRASGGVKARLVYVTEFGRIGAEELLEAHEKGMRFLFSKAGLFDLKANGFSWLHEKQQQLEGDCFLLSTLDFMRLDAKEGLMLHAEGTATAAITEKLLHSLRTFTLEQGFDTRGLKSTLRLYQQTGLKWLWFLYANGLSGLLCDDMGLGKTHQAMALMAAIANAREKKPLIVVVCPTSVIYHWQDKLATFLPHLRVQMFHGLKRKLTRPEAGGVIVTSYGIVRIQKEMFAKLDIHLAVYDEVQVAKNPKSGIHKALKTLTPRMHLGLTGTPIENNLTELKALFDLTLPGYLPKEAAFRTEYVTPIEREGDEEKKAQLIKLIKPFTLRRRKSEVLQELPSKSEDKSYCDLSEKQYSLYQEALAERRRALLTALENPDNKVPYLHIFSLLSSLKQICNHPALFLKEPENYKKYESGKWELFVELLSEALESEQKVVVFSQYLYMLDIMGSYLKEQKIEFAEIRGETQDRRGELERFQNEESCKVFLGSLQAAGLGIDLTAASVVIMYDRWWNLARENQAIDRVHRMGQKWGVQVFKLIAKETIEERIDQMITKKGRLMEEIVTADDQATLKTLSREELISLLR